MKSLAHLFTVVFMLMATAAFAQHIHLEENIDVGRNENGNLKITKTYRFTVEGENITRGIGFTGKPLRRYMKDSPEALYELDQFRRKKRAALGCFVGGALAIAGSTFSIRDDLQKSTTQNTPSLSARSGGLIALSLGCMVGNFVWRVLADPHIRRSVDAHNRSVNSDVHSHLLSRTSVGLSMDRAFTKTYPALEIKVRF